MLPGNNTMDWLSPILPMQVDKEEEAEEKEEDDNFYEAEIFVWPKASYILATSSDKSVVCFPQNRIPNGLYRLHPRIIQALNPIDDVTVTAFDIQSVETCLPILVYNSPIIVLFSSALHKNQTTVSTLSRLTTWMESTFRLFQIQKLCVENIIPFPSNLTIEAYENARHDYVKQKEFFQASFWDKMDTLIARANESNEPSMEVMNDFGCLLEEYSFDVLHRLERFIYQVLVEPHDNAPSLEECLTPRVSLHLSDFPDPKRAVDFVIRFFKRKVWVENIAYMQQVQNWKPLLEHPLTTRIDSQIIVKSKQEVVYQCNNSWKGLISVDTMCHYLDYIKRTSVS